MKQSGSPYRRALERTLWVLAGAGIVLTSHLSFWYGETAVEDPVCSGASDCASVIAQDPTLFGVSSATSGLWFYLLVAALGVAIAFDALGYRRQFKIGRLLLVGTGFLYSCFLTLYQVFALDDFCVLCFASFALVSGMAVVLFVELRKAAPARAARRTAGPPKRETGFFVIAGLLILGALAGDYAFFKSSVPEVGGRAAVDMGFNEALCRYDEAFPAFENLDQFISDADPSTGRADAPVTIMEFIDPNCPACKSQHEVMKQLPVQYPDEIRIVYKPVAIMGGSLLFSLDEAMALWLAHEQGVFEELIQAVFDAQNPEGLSVSELAEIADGVGLDAGDFRRELESRRLESRARRVARVFDGMGLEGVPAILINGRKVHSSDRSLGCLSYLIDQELTGEAL